VQTNYQDAKIMKIWLYSILNLQLNMAHWSAENPAGPWIKNG